MLDVNFLTRAREVGADSCWFKDVSRADEQTAYCQWILTEEKIDKV